MTPERRQKLVQLVRDVLLVAGAAAVAVGTGMIYRPAGVIVGGALMLMAGLRGSR